MLAILKRGLKILHTIWQVLRLPHVSLHLRCQDKVHGREFFNYFTRPHPRFKIIQSKSFGVEVIRLRDFPSFADYLQSINGKNSAAYYARKALSRGYRLELIDRNQYLDDIYEINTSAEVRQGKLMQAPYQIRPAHYDPHPDYLYFGVVDAQGKLHAYCWLMVAGEVALIITLLGHKQTLNDGTMYLLITRIVEKLFSQPEVKYLTYDTYFGASEGMKQFKAKNGFKPHRVTWSFVD